MDDEPEIKHNQNVKKDVKYETSGEHPLRFKSKLSLFPIHFPSELNNSKLIELDKIKIQRKQTLQQGFLTKAHSTAFVITDSEPEEDNEAKERNTLVVHAESRAVSLSICNNSANSGKENQQSKPDGNKGIWSKLEGGTSKNLGTNWNKVRGEGVWYQGVKGQWKGERGGGQWDGGKGRRKWGRRKGGRWGKIGRAHV